MATFLLLHGAASSGWYWHLVQPLLAATGHESATPDLPADDPDVLYGHDIPSDLWEEAGRRLRVQTGRPFEDPCPIAEWPGIPTTVIAARQDRLFPLEFQRQVAWERLGLEVETIPGGHLAALSQPRAVAGFSAAKHHLSYLPHSGSVLSGFDASDLEGVQATKGALTFPVDTDLPEDLVAGLVAARRAELER